MNPDQYKQFLDCQRKLYRFALSIIKNVRDAEDVYQETIVKIWQLKAEWGSWKNFEAYTMSMVHNACLNFIKKNTSRVYVALDDVTEVPEQNETDKNAVLTDLRMRFNSLISKLPEIQRNILYLREIEEMEYKEICEILGITEAKVKVYLFRGRQYLKNKVNGKR